MNHSFIKTMLSFPSMLLVGTGITAATVLGSASVPSKPAVIDRAGTSTGSTQTTTLEALEAAVPKDGTDFKARAEFAEAVMRLVEQNSLASGDEFYRAASLMNAGTGRFRTWRVRYELLLAATARDHRSAERELPTAWDTLMASLGRPPRFDDRPAADHPESFDREPAPELIRRVWQHPEEARAAGSRTENNAELAAIVEADQQDRKGRNWSQLTSEESLARAARDRERNARTRAIVLSGELHTASDFASASLVMQHSSSFAGYRLAHELAVSALLLGDRQRGRWLVAATYDRMLGSVGHDQRFGTQSDPAGLRRVDETGICDAEREALGCPLLTEARNPSTARGRDARPTAQTKLIQELTGPDHALRDENYLVSVRIPEGWRMIDARRWGKQQTTVTFSVVGHEQALSGVYYQILPQPMPPPAEGFEAYLRGEAARKAADRSRQRKDFANRPDSFVFGQIGGRPALWWTADFTEGDRRFCEHFVRVVSGNAIALFSMTVPVEELDAMQPQFDRMAETLQLP